MKTTRLWMLSVAAGCMAIGITALGAEGQWITDIEKAKAQAKKENRVILVNFTGSDWCPPCKAMHGEVLTQPAFVEYAKENLVLVEADFPRRKEQSAELKRSNQALMEEYKVRAYPTFVVLDAQGKELFRHEGFHPGGPKAFVEKMKEAKEGKRS
jgi:thiol-disulfide isomerase/thioredoxin